MSSDRFQRIALVTPYAWSVPNPVNEHIAQLASELVELRAREGEQVPQVVVVAPSLHPKARRETRRALHALAQGVDADVALGDPRLHASATRSKKRGGPGGDFPLLAVGLPIGATSSVALRASLRLLLERGGIDLVHVHDVLESDLTRVVARRWPGFTVASWHTAPPKSVLKALQGRVLDELEVNIVTDESLRAQVAETVGIDATDIVAMSVVDARGLLNAVAPLRERMHPYIAPPAVSERTCVIDLHMHTSHSWDCATDPEALLHVAKKVGLTAIAVTDHNEVSGALACAELADEYGLQVIVGEEVKTSQGEVIGLFLHEKIEAGLTWDETIAQIRAQDGLVYVPHPFDRLHTIPDVHTLRASLDEIDLFEVYNARLTFEQYNRDAERFARRYNLIEGAGSDAHVVQGLGTAAVHMPAWDDPESFLTALRQGEIMRRPKSLLYLQGLKLLDTVTGRTKQDPAPG